MSSHSSMRRQPSMITFSTFISTRMSSSVTCSSALNSNSPSSQLKNLKAVSWICSRTACSRVPRSMTPLPRRTAPMRAPSPSLFLRRERRLRLRGADGARLHEAFAQGQVLRHREGVVDEAVAEEDLAPLLATADRAVSYTHLTLPT